MPKHDKIADAGQQALKNNAIKAPAEKRGKPSQTNTLLRDRGKTPQVATFKERR